MNKIAYDSNVFIFSLFSKSYFQEHKRCTEIFNLFYDLEYYYDKDKYIRNNRNSNESLLNFKDEISARTALGKIINDNITFKTIKEIENNYNIVIPKLVFNEVISIAEKAIEFDNKSYEEKIKELIPYGSKDLIKTIFLLDNGKELKALIDRYKNNIIDCPEDFTSIFTLEELNNGSQKSNDKKIFTCCIYNKVYNILTCDNLFNKLKTRFEKINPYTKINIMTIPIIRDLYVYYDDFDVRELPSSKTKSQKVIESVNRLLSKIDKV